MFYPRGRRLQPRHGFYLCLCPLSQWSILLSKDGRGSSSQVHYQVAPNNHFKKRGTVGMQEWEERGAPARQARAAAGHLVPMMTTERLAELPPVGFKIFAEEGV